MVVVGEGLEGSRGWGCAPSFTVVPGDESVVSSRVVLNRPNAEVTHDLPVTHVDLTVVFDDGLVPILDIVGVGAVVVSGP